jgi:hypothetical protein
MTSELGVYRTANLLIQQSGVEEAPMIAANRADALLGLADLEGERVWKAILAAVHELMRSEPRPGEHRH